MQPVRDEMTQISANKKAQVNHLVRIRVLPMMFMKVISAGTLRSVKGFRQTQSRAPNGEAAPVLLHRQLFLQMELGDDPLEDGFALQDLYLCLEIILGWVRTGFISGGADVAHVEEILIEILNLQGG